MQKSQKKNAAHNKKPPVIHKPGMGAYKPSTEGVKLSKIEPKTTKKIANTLEKPAGYSKQSKVLTLLQRPAGATIEELAKATGWQRHSVQGMMSGVIRKRLGLTVTSDKEERGRVYRITDSVSRL